MSNRHPVPEPLAHQYEVGLLAEECGEVVQIIGKTLRHGYDSYSPKDPKKTTNLDLIHAEVGDVLGATSWAVEKGVLDPVKLEASRVAKLEKLRVIAPVPSSQSYNPLTGPSSSRKTFLVESDIDQPLGTSPVLPEPKVTPVKPNQKEGVIGVGIVVALALIGGMLFWQGRSSGYKAGMQEIRVEAAKEAQLCFANRAEAMGVTEVNVGDCEILAKLAGNTEQTS